VAFVSQLYICLRGDAGLKIKCCGGVVSPIGAGRLWAPPVRDGSVAGPIGVERARTVNHHKALM